MSRHLVIPIILFFAASLMAVAQTSSISGPQDTKIYLVGGDVRPPQPIETKNPEGSSSDKADGKKAKRYRGVVALTAIVGADGEVKRVRVDRGVNPDVDQKALDAVKDWKFKPATKNGVPVNVQIHININFDLS